MEFVFVEVYLKTHIFEGEHPEITSSCSTGIILKDFAAMRQIFHFDSIGLRLRLRFFFLS